MPIQVDIEAVKVKANEELHEEAFKAAVDIQKEKIKAKRQHLLPWKIKLQSPVTFHDHYTGEKI